MILRKLTASCLFATSSLILQAQSAKSGVEILDSRIIAIAGAKCPTSPIFIFRGNAVRVRSNSLLAADGAVSFATDAPIRDAVWHQEHEYVLTSRKLLILGPEPEKTVEITLPSENEGGKLLYTSPTFVSMSVWQGGIGAVLMVSSGSLRVVNLEPHYATSTIDLAGNILIAAESDVYAISRAGRRVPVIRLSGNKIRSLEVMDDDSLLIGTDRGLLKLSSNRHSYPLLGGEGNLGRTPSGFSWCDSRTHVSYELGGLELPGDPTSDKKQMALLIQGANDDIGSGKYEEAYVKVLQALEIRPEDKELSEIAAKLRQKLKK